MVKTKVNIGDVYKNRESGYLIKCIGIKKSEFHFLTEESTEIYLPLGSYQFRLEWDLVEDQSVFVTKLNENIQIRSNNL